MHLTEKPFPSSCNTLLFHYNIPMENKLLPPLHWAHRNPEHCPPAAFPFPLATLHQIPRFSAKPFLCISPTVHNTSACFSNTLLKFLKLVPNLNPSITERGCSYPITSQICRRMLPSGAQPEYKCQWWDGVISSRWKHLSSPAELPPPAVGCLGSEHQLPACLQPQHSSWHPLELDVILEVLNSPLKKWLERFSLHKGQWEFEDWNTEIMKLQLPTPHREKTSARWELKKKNNSCLSIAFVVLPPLSAWFYTAV